MMPVLLHYPLSDLKFIISLLNKSMKLINILLQQALQHSAQIMNHCVYSKHWIFLTSKATPLR